MPRSSAAPILSSIRLDVFAQLATRSVATLAIAAAITLVPSPAAAQCTTTRVTLGQGGQEPDGAAGTNSPNVNRNFLSADGRFVAYWSDAANVVAGDTNGVGDVFVYDRQAGTTVRVSVDSNGAEADGGSSNPAISADGRWIVFQSDATNLVLGDTNGKTDVFAHDMQTGTTLRCSVDSTGIEGNGNSAYPDISADGHVVVFQSLASNLVPADNNNKQDIFAFDIFSGSTSRISVDTNSFEGNNTSGFATISANGQFVAFHSAASNLVANDLNLNVDVFLRDRFAFTTIRVSTSSSGGEADYFSQTPSISADGRYIAFSSIATNLIPNDTNNVFDVFVKDRLTGFIRRASTGAGGSQGNSSSQGNSMSADGRYVGFVSQATNLVFGDTNGGPNNLLSDVFVRDLVGGGTERVDVDTLGHQTDVGSAFNICVARDASGTAFYSPATNLVAGDTNGVTDVFFHGCGATPPPTGYCFGDGTATACPCGNAGAHGHGCENSFATGGGLLAGAGTSSVANDHFTLSVSGLPPTTSTLFFQGDQQTANGAGAVFGDGLRCASGAVLRIGSRVCTAGACSIGAANPGDPLVSVVGGIPIGTISIRNYQAWYRNTAAFCQPEGFNLTNGLNVTWIP